MSRPHRPASDLVDEADPPVPAWVTTVGVAGIVGVSWYVASWAVAGWLTPGYDPVRQAISELFAIDAPRLPAGLVTTSLVGSGLALLAFAVALERALPGRGRAGPVAAAVSGAMTVAVVALPCTAGCPGFGASVTDSGHTLVAGIGYVALVLAPLLVAVRVRDHDPRLARWSLLLGGVAAVGFLVRVVGLDDATAGLQQRFFNTVADAWYVVAALALIRRARRTP